MKILHVFKTYFPESQGGVEETIRQICLSTAPLGAENHVFTLGPEKTTEDFYHDDTRVVRYHRNYEIASTGISFQALKSFRQVTSEMDVIHYHFPWPYADLMHLTGRIKKPCVLTYHSDIIRQKTLGFFYKPLMRYFLGHMRCIVATSPHYAKTSRVLKSVKNVEIIPIGIDQNTYPEIDSNVRDEIVQLLGKDFFLFIGVMRYYKGLHILLEAARNTSLPIVIAGAGPIEHELKAKKESYGLSNVIFLGRVSDQERGALYDLCRAVVFPSHMRSEAFGLTLVEGAMHKKPMISTEIGTGTSYINVHEETGLVVPPGNPRALRSAMQYLQGNPEVCSIMGQKSRERYERLFTAKTMGERYWNLYQRVV